MRILFLTTHLDYGGIPVYITSLAQELKRRGHQPLIVSRGGALAEKLAQSGIEHIRVDLATKSELSPKLLFSYLKLVKIIRDKKPDLIHAHTRIAQVLASLLSKKTGVPYVSTCHGFFKARFGRVLFPCWGHRVIAISEVVREHLVNDFKVKKEDARLIYNGVDVDKFSEVFSQEQKIGFRKRQGIDKGPIIGIVARLSSVKGHKYLLLAMEKVCRKLPDASLLVVGDGPLKKELVNMARKLACCKKIIFKDGVADTREYLSVMDIFVLPSVQEGLGLCLIEAMAMGKPVVASDVGGIYTVVKDQKTGLLVPPKDPESLAQAILKLVDNPDFSNKMAANARAAAREKFTLTEMADKTIGVYEEVIT